MAAETSLILIAIFLSWVSKIQSRREAVFEPEFFKTENMTGSFPIAVKAEVSFGFHFA
jgi:hypothetical protein